LRRDGAGHDTFIVVAFSPAARGSDKPRGAATFQSVSDRQDVGALVCSVFTYLVVVSVRWIKPTHVGSRAHVKIASRIVSYGFTLLTVYFNSGYITQQEVVDP